MPSRPLESSAEPSWSPPGWAGSPGDDRTHAVVLCGALDVRTVAGVRQVLYDAIAEGSGDVFVDVSEVTVTDVAGLGLLVGAHRRAQRAGRELVLSEVPARLARQLVATRLHRVLRVEPCLDPTAVLAQA